jgi:hypothetical protein
MLLLLILHRRRTRLGRLDMNTLRRRLKERCGVKMGIEGGKVVCLFAVLRGTMER